MAKLVFLGTSSAVAIEGRENTHLVLVGKQSTILIDCGGNPLQRLVTAGIDYQTLTDLIVTHFHPDHVSGLPLLLMDLWILGRKKPLNIYGTQHTLLRVNKMMDLFDWEDWNRFFPVILHHLPYDDLSLALENEEFLIHTSPVDHIIPTIGVRIEYKANGFRIAYSGDTNPCSGLVDLGKNADMMIHEAAGDYPGHSTAEQAGEIADRAGAHSLCLVHYPLHEATAEEMIAAARKYFSGEILIAEDLMEIDLRKTK